MSGVTKKDKISNEYIRGTVGVASIMFKIRVREDRLKWHEHVLKKNKQSSKIGKGNF